jgi:hypothetical protein
VPTARRILCIDNLNLSAATASLDVACFIPENGKVWIQVADASGKVIRAENFAASARQQCLRNPQHGIA